jgi:hypothetical protein
MIGYNFVGNPLFLVDRTTNFASMLAASKLLYKDRLMAPTSPDFSVKAFFTLTS